MYISPINKYHTRYFHLKYALKALKRVEGKILDLGCGKGGITSNIKRNRADLEFFACDNDKKALSVFEKSFKNIGVKLAECDAESLVYQDNFFDAVVMFDVLEHLEKPKQALSEVKRVLRKNGVFHLVVPLEAGLTTFDGWIKRLFGINLKKAPIGHIHQFSLDQIRKMLKDLGFTVQRERFSYHFIYQFISLLYYLFVALARRGKYMPLSSERETVNRMIVIIGKFCSWLVFLESSLLRGIRGQTVHISTRK